MKFYVTEQIGPKRSRTPEGFLLCEDVPISRTGVQLYSPDELDSLEAGPDNYIRIERPENEVFATKAVASFQGKAVVIEHPVTGEDVTPENWQELAVGTVMNPRRGAGIADDLLIADLLITRADAIEAVLSGKVEVSCGYDAEYEQIDRGRGRQINIIGNHVALVDKGRCGSRCSIGDMEMRTRDHSATTDRTTLRERAVDAIRAAFQTKDQKKLDEGIKILGELNESAIVSRDAEGVNVHLHMGGGTTEMENKDSKSKDDPYEARFKGIEDAMGLLKKGQDDLGAMFSKMGDKSKDKDPDEKSEDDEGEEATGDEGEEKEKDKDPDEKEKDADPDKEKGKDGKSKDSAARVRMKDSSKLADAFQAAISLAEVLSPGVAVPTFDSRSPATKTMQTLCDFRRRVLRRVHDSDGGPKLLEPLIGRSRVLDQIARMTCDEVRMVFKAAGEFKRQQNNAGKQTADRRDGDKKPIRTLKDINEANRAFYAPDARR